MHTLSLREKFEKILPKARVLDDPLSLVAIASDASFYELRPKIILDVLSPDEVKSVIDLCAREALPITFRAAGTSLSGQSLGEGALVRISRGFRGLKVKDQGALISLEPGVIGATANHALKFYKRKIGPDPATLQSAMIGGIAANNSSGMCCGVKQNTYHTLDSAKIILRLNDGVTCELDTGNSESREKFLSEQPGLCTELLKLRSEVLAQASLAEKIKHKYRIKNTMGYSINALIDFDDPIEIISHLMVGSEGTLGFFSEVTLKTVPDPDHRACALLFFKDIKSACAAAAKLKPFAISAAELMDRRSLRSVENKPGLPSNLKFLADGVTALLIETRALNEAQLTAQCFDIEAAFASFDLIEPSRFTTDAFVYEAWWNIRRGLFPSVGRGRIPGTTVIIEDVAFPIESLAKATEALLVLFAMHGYDQAILFGHALDGNLHFSFAQNFQTVKEVKRYESLMSGLSDLVLMHGGSLKAEHGTGRNMAPFVEKEWGEEAYAIMKRVKALLDPESLFNPGVILNSNPNVHIENLKLTPLVNALVDECIECGFCERQCPSKDLTLTPRQRIAAFRELSRLPLSRARAFEQAMAYPVDQTCAADGLCAQACPVEIDTGKWVKLYRARKTKFAFVAEMISKNFPVVLLALRMGLHFASVFNRNWPKASQGVRAIKGAKFGRAKVVYFPSCVARTLGPSRAMNDSRDLPSVMQSLFEKGDTEVFIPRKIESQCCGLAFESKGYPEIADEKLRALEAAMYEASEGGQIPIVCDTSPCSQRLKNRIGMKMKILDSVEWIHDSLLLSDALKISKMPGAISLHSTCSGTQMGLHDKLKNIALSCSQEVVVPEGVQCCGFAGDKGLTTPELLKSALKHLPEQIKKNRCKEGYSSSRTCEIGLAEVSKIPYQSIAYLVDQTTTR